MSNVVLRTEGLTKRYGSLAAVKDLTLEVVEGEVFGFLGPNGAGKTTSISMMCGLLILSMVYFATGIWLFKRTHLRAL